MNKHPLHIATFLVVIVIYLTVPFYMIRSYEKVLSKGEVFRFRPRPVDPYDPFRGKYITLSFTEDRVMLGKDNPDTYKEGETVYVTLKRDSTGFAAFDEASKSPPSHTASYIKTEVRDAYEGSLTIAIPFDQYNMNEQYAQLAEDEYNQLVRRSRSRRSEDVSTYVDVSVLNGSAIIQTMYMQDMPIMEYLKMVNQDSESPPE